MSKRQAFPITKSATAKQRPLRNLSAFVEVEEDNKADYVVSMEQPSQTIEARGDAMRQQVSRQALLQAWRSNPLNVLEEATPVQVTRDDFTTSDLTVLREPMKNAVEALKEEVLQNVSLKFGKMRNQLITSPVNQAVGRVFMNHCMWEQCDVAS